MIKKYKNMVHDLQNSLKRLQDRAKACFVVENIKTRDEYTSKQKHYTELSECFETQTSLREQLMNEKDERIKEKNHLLPFREKLESIDNQVRAVISISQEERELLKEIMEKKFHPFTGAKIIHLDFKGAPPLLPYLLKIIKQIKEIGGTGLLLEYEDMFPWKDSLESFKI